LLRKVFSCSIYDRVSLKQAFTLFPGNENYKCLFPGIRKKVSHWITRKIIDIDRIFSELEPDIVLLDYRSKIEDKSIEVFARYWKDNGVKVVLLPHAPHEIRETSKYVPYKYDIEELPKYCFYWEAFIHVQTWKMNVKRKDNFIFVGYPGLDSKWLQNLKDESNNVAVMKDNHRIRVLLVIRNFTSESSGDSKHLFIQSYQEVFKQIELTVNALNSSLVDYELIIKPHPSTSIECVREILVKIKVIDFKISYQPYSNTLEDADMVLSSFSTTMVIPPLYGLPIVIYNDRTMAYVEEWGILKKLYRGFEFYSVNDEIYQNNIKTIINAFTTDNTELRHYVERDREHVRTFFPDNASHSAVCMLNKLLDPI
ncbi:hypothetical protein N8135_03465, partial [Oceanospirillaceae bacterium]|nr:hypothetical protein [Oceanospirillaceae bacterium]